MAAPRERRAGRIFTQPTRQILLMLGVLVLVGIGGWLAYPSVAPVFLANPLLNGFIALVFVIGILSCFWQEFQIIQSVRWLEDYASDRPDPQFSSAPRLLAPLATLLRSRGRRREIGATASRSILDSVATRIDEARDITRYIVNLLIFLGLLGTFYGLATTVPAIVDTIRTLAPTEGEDGLEVFGRLMSGLERQLGGMGVAFASSLLGLAGSLVVGLLELFAGHGQNRFFRELEEWLSSITRIGLAAGDDSGSEEANAVLIMEHMSSQIDRLQDMFAASDQARAAVDDQLGILAGNLERIAERIDRDTALGHALMRVADGQERLAASFEAVNEAGGIDAESRMRLRSIDVQMLRLLEEISAGRQEMTAELGQEIRTLGRMLTRPPARADLTERQG
ncbi:hypothetical protein LX81_02408 [Palleronia aestuarii]|uniref:MotA/TolQ/ExbB proton channel family protein n=1 Tax=Palleronia aestuarii TaxID=568105 RepID=A0A2W7N5U5_9RHOB|nr:biopolymer transporter ExbB [Palleronia aestuarii]PZX15775.1 hypothetical protein LX81_02408 [Palleronia aestuarii]